MKTTTSQHGERCLWRRSWSVGIATALLAAAPFVASAQNDGTTGGENSTSSYEGVAGLTGQTFDQLKAGITTDYSYKDPSKVYFLYNVGTGKFLNVGGYWGTHAALKDYPTPLWTREGTSTTIGGSETPSLNFAHTVATNEGNMVKWVDKGANITTDIGVFCDRGQYTVNNGYDGWFFEKTTDSNGKNDYLIYTFKTTTSSSGFNSQEGMYLTAFNEGQATADRNCGADTYTNICTDGTPNDNSKWRVLTLQDIYDLQKKNTEGLKDPLDFSFMLKCPGFDRGRTDITGWNVFTSSFATGAYTRIGLQECNYKNPITEVSTKATSLSRGNGEAYNDGIFKPGHSGQYTFPYSGSDPQTINNKNDYLRYMAKFFCMDIHGTHGYIYQKMSVTQPGVYVVECKAYSNTEKAHLFAGVAGKELFEPSKRTTILSQVSNMTEDEKSRLHVDDQNMDYAGKEFYESNKYTNSVSVHVTKEMIEQAGAAGGVSIAFGIYIGNPNDASETPDPNEWTVFDDFRVLYASNTKSPDLILDELRGDLDYLRNGTTTYTNRMLHLAKTFTKDHWNSFVLPVDLTVKQVRDAFGANVRLAKLKNLTNTELQFETVNLDENEKATAIQAYQPYIIFPTKTMEAYNGTPYTANITTGTGSDNKVTIQGQRFEIPNVTFKMTDDNKNDLTNMEANWTTKLTHKAGAITAYGTFVRTFDPNATQDQTTGAWAFSSNKGTIREGYDKLIGSYFFDNGNVYYTENPEKVRGLRGFSCWFKPKNDKTKIEVFIDGMKQEAELTAIGELIVGPEAANRYGKNNGVYNLQGQRVGNTTEGLPSGIYIVNGRKHVVR